MVNVITAAGTTGKLNIVVPPPPLSLTAHFTGSNQLSPASYSQWRWPNIARRVRSCVIAKQCRRFRANTSCVGRQFVSARDRHCPATRLVGRLTVANNTKLAGGQRRISGSVAGGADIRVEPSVAALLARSPLPDCQAGHWPARPSFVGVPCPLGGNPKDRDAEGTGRTSRSYPSLTTGPRPEERTVREWR